MDINTVTPGLQVAPAPTTVPVDTAAQNREVVQAIKALNGTELFGEDNQLRFQKDQRTGRIIVKVVNTKTDEVVTQIPPEYILSLAADLKKSSSE